MGLDDNGLIQANVGGRAGNEDEAEKVCPFGDSVPSENEIAASVLADCLETNPFLGRYNSIYTGYCCEEELRAKGSSGGMGRWLLAELLSTGVVDRVIHVTQGSGASSALHEYVVATTRDEILSGSTSAYYPVTLADVLQEVRDIPGKYAVTGVPCFIKALRLLEAQDALFRDRIKIHVGIICGHLKSRFYAELLAWQMGIDPTKLAGINFRAKIAGTRANEKGVVVQANDGSQKGPRTVQTLFGADYNLGFMQYPACDYCDDVVAELADVSIGDAWLPDFIKDGRGTSLVIARKHFIDDLLREAGKKGRLSLQACSPEDAVKSQAGGFRQRREGLAYRLYLSERDGRWHPPKRTRPEYRHISRLRRKIYKHRMLLSQTSHAAFLKAKHAGTVSLFESEMVPLVREYASLNRGGPIRFFIHRVIRKIKRTFAP